MSDKNLVLIVLVFFIMLSIFGVLIVSSLMAYVIKTNKIEL